MQTFIFELVRWEGCQCNEILDSPIYEQYRLEFQKFYLSNANSEFSIPTESLETGTNDAISQIYFLLFDSSRELELVAILIKQLFRWFKFQIVNYIFHKLTSITA